jgi:hypothetical protein
MSDVECHPESESLQRTTRQLNFPLGIFEDNDPSGRMLAIVNYNNDIAEYWEWSDAAWLPSTSPTRPTSSA